MVGFPGASSDSAYTSGCMAVGMISIDLNPAARKLSATHLAARSMSGLCSLFALTLGMRKDSFSSVRCCSWRLSINSARFIFGGRSKSFPSFIRNLSYECCGEGAVKGEQEKIFRRYDSHHRT